jgi:hypothetical protein
MLLEQALLDVVDRLEDVLRVAGEGVAVRPPPHLLEDQAQVQIALVRPAAAPLHNIRLYRSLNEYTIFVVCEKIANILSVEIFFFYENRTSWELPHLFLLQLHTLFAFSKYVYIFMPILTNFSYFCQKFS